MSERLRQIGSLLAAVWAGSLVTICGIVAPTLFATVGDRSLAGQLAGRFFSIATWLGLALAAALFAIVATRRPFKVKKPLLWLIGLTAYVPFQVQQQVAQRMATARASGDIQTLELAHTLGGITFVGACIGALSVVWTLSRPAE